MRSSLVFSAFPFPWDRDSLQEIADILVGGSIKDEKKPEEKLKTEDVKAFLDGCEGSKSDRINEVGKDEDLESISQGKDEEKKLNIDDLDCWFGAELPPDFYGRRDRAWDARRFTDHYKFALGGKFCIRPYGPPIFCLSDCCLESTWVGVHGMQSMCIVTRRDVDMTCLPTFYQRDCMKQQNMEMFARAAISEVECLPHQDVEYYDGAFRGLCTGSVKKPFAVVSLRLGALEEFGYEDSKPLRCCDLKTINYLESVVSSDLLHTHYGIIRVALKAYQLMCHKELRADDIWVTIMEDVEPSTFEHLPIDIIGEQLDIVNGLSSEKDPQKPILEYRGSLQ